MVFIKYITPSGYDCKSYYVGFMPDGSQQKFPTESEYEIAFYEALGELVEELREAV